MVHAQPKFVLRQHALLDVGKSNTNVMGGVDNDNEHRCVMQPMRECNARGKTVLMNTASPWEKSHVAILSSILELRYIHTVLTCG